MPKKSNANLLAVICHLALKNIQIKTGSRCEHFDRAGYSGSSHIDLSNTDLIDARLQCAVDAVYHPHLRTFLQTVFAEPEVRQILIQPLPTRGKKGASKGLRIDPLQSMAEGVQHWCNFGKAEREVVYVATFLHGIEHWLVPCMHPDSDVRDVMFTIARSALHRLDDAHPAYGGLLRLCMGWSNPDEESEFAVELQQRIAFAVETLDLANF
jgi:hypothetical protein